jgi:hypothetical protein
MEMRSCLEHVQQWREASPFMPDLCYQSLSAIGIAALVLKMLADGLKRSQFLTSVASL